MEALDSMVKEKIKNSVMSSKNESDTIAFLGLVIFLVMRSRIEAWQKRKEKDMKIYFVDISGAAELNSRGMAKCFANKAEAVKAAKQFCRESDGIQISSLR